MNKVILGVDPSFSSSGYALLNIKLGKTYAIDYGYLPLSSSQSLSQRVHKFYNFCRSKIIEFNVTHIALETPFLGKNPQTFLKLGYLRGILYLLAQQHNCLLSEFSPRHVKTVVTGFGGANKEQVALMIARLFPKLNEMKKTVKNDVTDALAIALCSLWQR